MLDTLETIYLDASLSAPERIAAAALAAQVLEIPVDIRISASAGWRDALIRIRHKVSRKAKQLDKQAKADRKSRSVRRVLTEIRQLQNDGEKK